jgi:UrcA family protein
MSRLLMFGAVALAATALPLAPATAQSDYGYDSDSSSITVTAPHSRRVGRTASGAPIIQHEAAQTVDYSDLDLRNGMDRERLRMRVDVAAYEACAALDDIAPSGFDTMMEPRDCHADAMRRAQGQVDAVIDSANYYGY